MDTPPKTMNRTEALEVMRRLGSENKLTFSTRDGFIIRGDSQQLATTDADPALHALSNGWAVRQEGLTTLESDGAGTKSVALTRLLVANGINVIGAAQLPPLLQRE